MSTGRSPAGRGGKEGGRGPDGWPLPDFPASLCSLRTEMERVQQEQSKVRLGSGGPCCPFCSCEARPHRRGQAQGRGGGGSPVQTSCVSGHAPSCAARGPSPASCPHRPSSQTCSQSRGRRCCGCRRSWRPVSRCRGTLYDCPRPCRYAVSPSEAAVIQVLQGQSPN